EAANVPGMLQRLDVESVSPPGGIVDCLLVPEIARYDLEIHRFLTRYDQQQLLWPVDWQPMQEVTPGAKRYRMVIGIVHALHAAMQQDSITGDTGGADSLLVAGAEVLD